MGKVAFVFPGQGSQYVGMGYDFYKEFAEAADVFHSAETALRYNLSQIIFKGPEEELNRTINTTQFSTSSLNHTPLFFLSLNALTSCILPKLIHTS